MKYQYFNGICILCSKSFASYGSRPRKTCSKTCHYEYLRKINHYQIPNTFWQTLRANGECLEWPKTHDTRGYGQLAYHGKLWRAHRLAWFLTNGPIPKGIYVCHKCDNRLCCRPSHLFLGTQLDNMQDCARKGRTLKGSQKPTSKLTESDVAEIKAALENRTSQTLTLLVERYGVRRQTIDAIIDGRTWRHV